jgi:hypothetical protein
MDNNNSDNINTKIKKDILKPAKDICHYSCTMINYTNIMLFILIILLIYLIIKN